jgi:DNA invertase Pin-like site-specific DNA recombinase
LVQKEAIATFAHANDIEIVRTYEDEGRSGVQLKNRAGLRRLLADVTTTVPFSEILVYDVSRWGRFQDADASAYYEYHCRLHGVQVIYIGESFGNDQTPTTVLLKSMRRVMAAEYSRDIAFKARAGQQRVVTMGFHMGPLPAFGYRRCSVSADGGRRVMLEHGQRKSALTDRVEWVLGPDAEVALVRRLCAAYAGGLQLEQIAGLVNGEGWRTDKGRALSTRGVRNLLENEALIGNFVWGVKSKGGKVIQSSPTRRNGSVPRIIDDETWTLIQTRLKAAAQSRRTTEANKSGRPTDPHRARPQRQLHLPLWPSAAKADTYRRSLGTVQELRSQPKEFGYALAVQLRSGGLPATFDSQAHVLAFWSARVRVRLMWPTDPATWLLDLRRDAAGVPHLLVARMAALYCPVDFLLLRGSEAESAFAEPLPKQVPPRLRRYLCTSAEHLVARLSALAGGSALGGSVADKAKHP